METADYIPKNIEKKEKTNERVGCSNPGCKTRIREDTQYQINNQPYCADCYIFLTKVR